MTEICNEKGSDRKNRISDSDESIQSVKKLANNRYNTPWGGTKQNLPNMMFEPFYHYLKSKNLFHEFLLDPVVNWAISTYPWPTSTDMILHMQGSPEKKERSLIAMFNIVFGGTYQWATNGDDIIPIDGRTLCLDFETLSDHAKENNIRCPCVIVGPSELPEHWAEHALKIPLQRGLV